MLSLLLVLGQFSQPSTMNLNEQPIIAKDEGVKLGASASTLNCVGAGVTCTKFGNTMTLNVPGGGGGGGASTPDGGTIAANYASPFALWQADTTLPSGRVLTSGTNTTVDNGTPGQTKFNVSGTLPQSVGGMGAASVTCAANQYVTCNGTVCSCSTTPPLNAEFVTYSSNATLTAERVLTAGTNITLDTATPGQVIINASGGGGGGGSANVVEASLSLTTSGYFSATVTGQAWVSGTSKILCEPFATTADGLTPEVIAVSGVRATAANRVAATGFDVLVFNPNGLVGTVRIHCTGA